MNFYYEIKLENGKYNIYYTGGDYAGLKEFYAYDLSDPQTVIRYGYKEIK
jgi:hypothetical protein